jgi:hypothetical protein
MVIFTIENHQNDSNCKLLDTKWVGFYEPFFIELEKLMIRCRIKSALENDFVTIKFLLRKLNE